MKKIVLMAIAIVMLSGIGEAGVQSEARARREMEEVAQVVGSRMDWTLTNAKISEILARGYKCSSWKATREGFMATCSKSLTWNREKEVLVQLFWNEKIATEERVQNYTGAYIISMVSIIFIIAVFVSIIRGSD